ncbi:30S ribosomal protein S6, partial [bacterium]|nr:30S ribosomal protein S6 [bacterium]
MRIYEAMFVLDDARSGSNWDGVVTEVRGILERRGAEIFTCERWDERRLAYRIQGRTRAVYLLIRFTVPTEAISPIKIDCELNETILRALILRDHGSEKLHKEGLFPPQEAPAPAAPAPAAEAPAADAPAADAPAADAPAADAPAADAPAADA